MKRGMVLGLIFGAGIAVTQAWQPAPPPNVAQIEKVKDNLYMITGAGGGGNTAAFVTATGVVLVDTKNPNWGQAILDQVKTVTNKPSPSAALPSDVSIIAPKMAASIPPRTASPIGTR